MSELSFSLIIVGFFGFSLLYAAAVMVFKSFPALNLHIGLSPYKAASRITALCHSSLLLPFVWSRLYSLWPHLPYLAPNAGVELQLMSFSFSYFSHDLLHFLLVEPSDSVLLLHHLIAIGFYTSVIHAQQGGVAMLAALLMGEATNPLQCLWYLSKLSNSTTLYLLVSPVFTVCFLLMRVVVVPLWVADIIPAYYAGWRDGRLGGGYALCWSLMCVGMTVGSWLWSWQLAKGFLKMWKGKDGKDRLSGGKADVQHVPGEFAAVKGSASKYA